MEVERVGYCAPEVFEGGYGVKSDVWSLGVLLFKAMTGVFPYSGHCEEAIPQVTDPFDILADSGIHSTELFDFLQKCLVKSVNERWSVSELMDHPFVNKSVIRIKKEGNSEELAKIVVNMKSLQFNDQSVGNASHSNHGSEGAAKTNGLPKEEKKRERKKELPLRVDDKSQSVVDMGEDSEIESVEDEERPSTKEIVVNCVSCIFSFIRVMLSVALGVSVFV
ncbi:hypothetical protein WA577_000850, partial [Blastocystis sp. JDR]